MEASIFMFIAGFSVGAILIWVIRKLMFDKDYVSLSRHEEVKTALQQTQTANAILQQERSNMKDTIGESERKTHLQDAELQRLRKELYIATTQKESAFEKLDTQKKDLEEIKQKLETEFKVIAGTILDNNAKKFNEQQETNLKVMLDPLREKISEFRNEIDSRYNNETKERASLRTEIKQVMEMNQRLSKDAENLTNALRGSTKQQGDWGEAILERILEYVGLQKEIHFTVQETGKNEDGTTIRPDVLVKYPDNRVVIIDSKVSLIHYEQYCAATTEEQQTQYRILLVRSVKAHIDGLAGKKYTNLPGTLDTVMMFVPVEAAFITASQGDPALWQYAYDRKIILLSPTILLGAMKLVYDYWKRDNVNRNAQEIAKKAGSLYDKLVGFVAGMDDIGRHLERANTSFTTAYAQLRTGKGNLITQAEKMKQLHISSSKQLPADLIHEAQLEDEQDVE